MRGEQVCGSKLNDIAYGKPLSQVYFRAGAVSAVVVASVLAYAVAYVITVRPLFVWYTPIYLFVAASAFTLLLTFVYMAVVSALGKRFSKKRFAVGRVSSEDLTGSGFDFDVAVTRECKRLGYSRFETSLVWVAVLSLMVSVVALGIVTGKEGESVIGFSKFILSSITDHTDVVRKVFCVGAIVFLCAFVLLSVARIFVEDGINKVSIFMMASRDSQLDMLKDGKLLGSEGISAHSSLRRYVFPSGSLLEMLLDMVGAEKVKGGSGENRGPSAFLDKVIDSKKDNSIVLKHVVLVRKAPEVGHSDSSGKCL